MRKRRDAARSSKRATDGKSSISATALATNGPPRPSGLPARQEMAIHIAGNTPQERWREVAKVMAADAAWQHGVKTFALILHSFAERNETEEMRGIANSFTGLFHAWVTDEARQRGLTLTEDQADDVGSAFFSAALDIVDTLSFCGTENAS